MLREGLRAARLIDKTDLVLLAIMDDWCKTGVSPFKRVIQACWICQHYALSGHATTWHCNKQLVLVLWLLFRKDLSLIADDYVRQVFKTIIRPGHVPSPTSLHTMPSCSTKFLMHTTYIIPMWFTTQIDSLMVLPSHEATKPVFRQSFTNKPYAPLRDDWKEFIWISSWKNEIQCMTRVSERTVLEGCYSPYR